MQWGYKVVSTQTAVVTVTLPLKSSKYLSSSACFTNANGDADIAVRPNVSTGSSIVVVIDTGKTTDWSFTWIAFTLV